MEERLAGSTGKIRRRGEWGNSISSNSEPGGEGKAGGQEPGVCRGPHGQTISIEPSAWPDPARHSVTLSPNLPRPHGHALGLWTQAESPAW